LGVADDAVSVKAFRSDLRTWLDRAAAGRHVTIIRSGEATAVLIPAPKESDDDE
jgi:antitoxin (DNA-binding transcriptional repressor) of toxin-antitoxin stability system